ncbi:S8 family serine peptidase [Aliiglaciecola litoralis]|uniref:Peptidase S8/S53 domain-containing protein n=1 Tax=Aliiglaciecola litoralis TaxID=582857 RepID=A0ABP3X786_9ALTE
MTTSILSLCGLLLVSQSLSAQIINPNNVTKQVQDLKRISEHAEARIKQPTVDKPFSLSSLPPIENVVTEPLTSLPQSLSIGADINNPVIIDVEVEDGWRAVQYQWLILADANSRQTLLKLGANIQSQTTYSGLGLSLLQFTVPASLDSKNALAKHLPQSAMQTLGRNHIYQAQASAQSTTANNEMRKSQDQAAHMCSDKVKIGIIDSAIDQQHRAFSSTNIHAKSFLIGDLTSPNLHGTAVASILVGNTSGLSPLTPNAHLYSAEVFYRQSDYSQGATLSAIISALNWLTEQHIKVVNMSLAGPANQILEQVIHAAHTKGVIIVAAAGNEGPAAPAVFPAGYEQVVAVSAIDYQQQPYRWSNRGDYIDFSALGVNVVTAQSQHRLGKESGTSMAAPVVTAAVACLMANLTEANKKEIETVLSSLSDQAIDLGPKGKDPIYGVGAIERILLP